MTTSTSLAADICHLFTDRDIQGMSRSTTTPLTTTRSRAHAQAIHDRIRGIGGAIMPPPPPVGDGPWPQANVQLFERWLADGCPP